MQIHTSQTDTQQTDTTHTELTNRAATNGASFSAGSQNTETFTQRRPPLSPPQADAAEFEVIYFNKSETLRNEGPPGDVDRWECV